MSVTTNLGADSTASLIAGYLGAIGTVCAVLVALFLQVVLVRLRRPQLSVDLSLDPKDDNLIAIRTHLGHVDCYLGVKVRAKARKNAARNVEAFLVKVIRPAQASNDGIIPSASLDWASSGGARTVDIPSGTWRRLTLLRYRGKVKNPDQQETLMPVLNLPLKTPFHRRYLLDDSGTYQLIIELSANGVDPTFWRLSFDHRHEEVEREEELLIERVRKVQCIQLSSAEVGRL